MKGFVCLALFVLLLAGGWLLNEKVGTGRQAPQPSVDRLDGRTIRLQQEEPNRQFMPREYIKIRQGNNPE